MENQDILFKTQNGVFSYRVAGVLIQEGKVMLQHEAGDPGYAFPGGHVSFGETSEESLVREFKEEIAADVRPVRLLWIGENFFPWPDGRDCHQVCLYYLVELGSKTQIPLEGSFLAEDELEGKRIGLEFCWIKLSDLEEVVIYPPLAKEKLTNLAEHTERFVYIEK